MPGPIIIVESDLMGPAEFERFRTRAAECDRSWSRGKRTQWCWAGTVTAPMMSPDTTAVAIE
jgi:hypothetical protein